MTHPNSRTLAVSLSQIVLACGLTVGTAQAADDPMSKTGTKYKANADMQAVLDELASLGGKPIETLTPAEARKQPTPTDAVVSLLKKQGKDTSPTALVPGVTSVDREIPGAAGNIPARIYTPDGPGPFPVVVYFHGGGWVIADKQVYDGGARGLAKQANAIVVSPDYRRAPEAKFPASHDDAVATYKWAAANAASLKGDPKRMALAGESAGGNMAVATAMAARDMKLTPPLHVLAVYPVAQTGDLNTKSYVDSATAKPLNKAMIEWFVDKLLAKPDDKKDPRLDLIHANLTGPAARDDRQRADRSAPRGRFPARGGPEEGWRQGRAQDLRRRDARVLRDGGCRQGRGRCAGLRRPGPEEGAQALVVAIRHRATEVLGVDAVGELSTYSPAAALLAPAPIRSAPRKRWPDGNGT